MRLRQMNLNLLVQLDAMLRTRNVTRAAAELNMSQSALSATLARLRHDLNDELLVRQGRELALTPYAESLAVPLSTVLGRMEQLLTDRPTFDPQLSERDFTVVASDYTSLIVLQPLLHLLAQEAARVTLAIHPLRDDYADKVLRDEVDLAIVSRQLITGPLADCPTLTLHEDRFVLTGWTGAPHLTGKDVTELERRPFVQYVTGRRSNLADDALTAAGIERRIEVRTQSQLLIPYLLTGTSLVSMVPGKLAERAAMAAQLQSVDPPIAMPKIEDTAVWHSRRHHDPAHQWLRSQILRVLS